MTETTNPLDDFRTLEERLAALRAEAETLSDAQGELSRLQVASELGEGVPAATLKAAEARVTRSDAMPDMAAEIERRLLQAAGSWRDGEVSALTVERDLADAEETRLRADVEKFREALRAAEVDHFRASTTWTNCQNTLRELGALTGEALVVAARKAIREAERAAQGDAAA